MASNQNFHNVLHPYYMNFPYFYPTNFVNYQDGLGYTIENSGFYQFYPPIAFQDQFYNMKDQYCVKYDEMQAVEQTQSATKQNQIKAKPKRTQAPRFRPTKNNESNISNQAFSFVTNQNKSKSILQTYFKSKKKAQTFYQYSKLLTSKRKKYMSKNILLKLCRLTQFLQFFEGLSKVKFSSNLSILQFQSGVRFLILHFLKFKSSLSILTSQKIVTNLKKDHIAKSRQIIQYLEQNIRKAQQMQEEQDYQIVKTQF